MITILILNIFLNLANKRNWSVTCVKYWTHLLSKLKVEKLSWTTNKLNKYRRYQSKGWWHMWTNCKEITVKVLSKIRYIWKLRNWKKLFDKIYCARIQKMFIMCILLKIVQQVTNLNFKEWIKSKATKTYVVLTDLHRNHHYKIWLEMLNKVYFNHKQNKNKKHGCLRHQREWTTNQTNHITHSWWEELMK